MAIIGFCGRQGSGKTLSLIREAERYQKKGFKIFSNIELNREKFLDYKLYTLDELKNYDKNNDFNDCVLIVDEAHIFLDSRLSMSKRNLGLSYMISQARKRNMSIIYTTQFWHQVEFRLRENTDVVVDCWTIEIKEDVKVTFQNIGVVTGRNTHRYHKDWFFSAKFYDYYNTREVVKYSELDSENSLLEET